MREKAASWWWRSAALAAVMATTWAGDAAAAGDGRNIGQNARHLFSSWAHNLFIGIVALVSLVFLLHRRFADLAVFVIAAVVVGGFVLVPDAIIGTIEDIWNGLTA